MRKPTCSLRKLPIFFATWSSLLSVGCSELAGPAGPAAFETPRIEGYADPLSAPATPNLSLDEFASAQQCAGCHPQHYAEWQHSAHAQSMNDPVFRALLARQRLDRGEAQDRFCTQCHSALGTRSGDVQPGFEFAELAPLTLEGVTCDGCHRVTSLVRPYGSGHELVAGTPLKGPFADAEAPHATERSSLLGSSEFCGGCHDVRDADGLVLESPLSEWLTSPAQEDDRPCQSCHMPTYAGRAASTDSAPERETLHRHWFTGVELPLGLGDGIDDELEEELHERTLALLESSAALRLTARPSLTGQVALRVEIENRIDGHDFPTGSSFYREFWLALELRDADGQLLHQSGQLDTDGTLFDRHHPRGREVDPALARFGAYLLDEHGEPTDLPWNARSIDKHVLAPLAKAAIAQRVAIPHAVRYPLTARARLRFRAFSPRLLRALGLDAYLPKLEIVDLADVSVTVAAP